MEKTDIVIVGAGPYGLSAAAHLHRRNNAEIRLFGEPMSFWERHMPGQMLLRSPWVASYIADPENSLTLDVYREVTGKRDLAYPIPVQEFISYGHWFHDQIALAADRRKVLCIQQAAQGYELMLEDGTSLRAGRVVVAGGIQPFAHRPKIFEGLPAALVTHASDPHDFEAFRGKEVLVVGAGQSALEAAAFLSEAGARVEVAIRNSVLHWIGLRRIGRILHTKGISWMFYGKGDVGPAGISRAVQHPDFFRRLPRSIQTKWGRRAIRPAVSERLIKRTKNVTIHTALFPVEAKVDGARVKVRMNDGTERIVDHVVLGTGYRVDITRYPFLSPALLKKLDIVDGYPRLARGFESSLPGLHFLGAPATWSFGPLMRFVAGTDFSSPALARKILKPARGFMVQGYTERYPEPKLGR
jgi:cation diffusion facilitator CzcD-associated flavoprotein CzcO